jgi:hypothetical protein
MGFIFRSAGDAQFLCISQLIYNTPLPELYAALYAEMEQEVFSLRKNMPTYQLMQRGPRL